MKPSWSSSNSPVRGRRGRLSDAQVRALTDLSEPILPNEPIAIADIWGDNRPVVIDIGFGDGESTVALANSFPNHAIIAIDIHRPGIARLLTMIRDQGISNIRIIPGNAIDVFDRALRNVFVDRIQTLFPDPWPKARHHKRRLLQPPILNQFAQHTQPGATWHIATDWEPYAEHIGEIFALSPDWEGGPVERPPRTMTKYERRGHAAGRAITDFAFTRITGIFPSAGTPPPLSLQSLDQ